MVLSVLLPRRCAVCERPGPALCDGCRGRLRRVGEVGCARCGAPGHWPVSRCAECAGRRLAFTTARAAIVYDEVGRALVRAWKELGRRDLAEPLASLVASDVARPDVAVVTYVPGDRERGLVRGHVPVAGLAAALARRWGLECVPLLERERHGTKRQAELARGERTANVRHAFRARAHAPPDVCLVDDVYTTGATVNACARALRTAGARRTIAVCLARAVR